MKTARTARNALLLTFGANGFAFASWASRIPDVRHALALSDPQLGLLLLTASIGSVTALPATGPMVHRLGVARVVAIGVTLVVAAQVGIAVGVASGSAVLTGGFLFAYGAGTSIWDVAMNVEGAEVERRLGRPIMPRFHAAFSLGTVVGALVGALMSHLSPNLAWHLPFVAVAVLVSWRVTRGSFLPAAEDREESSGSARAWRERRTLLIGLVVLAMALTEGVANDWLAVALRDGYHVVRPVAVLGFALFVASMTLGRVLGPVVLTRFGRVRVLFATIGAAAVGVTMVVAGGTAWVWVPGIVLWGVGASLGFPVGMSAAADDPARAAARVSVVSTIGYTAFFVGPPAIGALAGHVGTLDALVLLLAVLAPACAVVPATAPRAPRPSSGRLTRTRSFLALRAHLRAPRAHPRSPGSRTGRG
ncbi:MAG TPA: MFS transporter [Marmoricola sp.]